MLNNKENCETRPLTCIMLFYQQIIVIEKAVFIKKIVGVRTCF